MTKEKNSSSSIPGNRLWEEEEKNAQEDFREELNEKLLAGLSDMQNLQNEDIPPERMEAAKNRSQTAVHARRDRRGGKSKKVKRGFKIALTGLMAVLLVFIAVAACAVGIYGIGKSRMTSSADMNFRVPEGIAASSDNNGRTVICENKEYRYRTGTTNILLIGKNPDHTFSTVVVNFAEESKTFRFMPVPAALLAVDYSSSMNYSDIADSVSKFLCGLPLQGYMVFDMQIVDSILEIETDQLTDSAQMQKLTVFVDELTDNASENWMIPAKVFEKMKEVFSTNLQLSDLSYIYRLFIVCDSSLEYEFAEPSDMNMVFQQYLRIFYEEKQE